MIIEILDTISAQALESDWTIKYVALSPTAMKVLVREVLSLSGTNFVVDALSMYKDIPLKVKDIVGFQVAYDLPKLT